MWLLDKNVPIQLRDLLQEFDIEALTAESKGWGELKNGALVDAAVADGVSCILTRDRLFAQSAAKAIRSHGRICIVIVTLDQLRAPAFLEAFGKAWSTTPITPVAGLVIRWPG